MSVAEYIGRFEHDSAEWHAARAGGIGASEISAVVGLSPWESHFGLWHRKAGNVGPVEMNEEMRWGHYLEPAIAQRFADEHPGIKVRRTGTWRSRVRPWQLANPDRLGFPGRIPVEIKWAPYSDGWGPSGSDEVPVYYRCQVMQQLDVMGAEYGWLAALVGTEYREYPIQFDAEDAGLLRKAGAEFMASLEAGMAPAIDATGHTYRVLKELHPDIEDRDVEITPELAREYRLALAGAKDASKAEQLVKNRMLDAMGTARRAVCDGERVALRKAGARGSIALVETKPKTTVTKIKENASA